MSSKTAEMLDDIRRLIDRHAQPDLRTPIDGLLLAKVTRAGDEPDYSLATPLLVVMAQGGKRLLVGDQVLEYRSGQCLIVTAEIPVTGNYIDIAEGAPSLSMGLVLRPAAIAALVLETPMRRRSRSAATLPAIATGAAEPDLLDAVTRLLRLLDQPDDAAVLAPLFEREILWRLLTGPHGESVRQIGLPDSDLSHVSRAIGWIRENYAEPMRVDDLAQLSAMSSSAFHRHFRAVTAMSPLQFQKRIRLQHARSLLAAHPGDVAGVGHLVGYESVSQFNREYRRLFGAPPGRDVARLRAATEPVLTGPLP